MVFALFDVNSVMQRSMLELLACWHVNFGRHRNLSIWTAVLHCLILCIWRERNGRSFEDCERSFDEIRSFFLRSLFDWVAGWGSHSCTSLFQFLELCSLQAP